LSNLDRYIPTIVNEITKFNQYVKTLIRSLAARGKHTEDLLTNLFKGYMVVTDKDVVRFISRKLEKYEGGKDISTDELMQLADNKFRLLKEKGMWEAPSQEEENIMALQS